VNKKIWQVTGLCVVHSAVLGYGLYMSMKWKENEWIPYGILKAWTMINIMSTIINSTWKYKFSPTYLNTCE